MLNEKFSKWLLNDYQKQPHSGLSGETPLDFFLRQAEKVELVTDLAEFNRKLLITVKRTVKKDATISFNSCLYETEMFLAGERLNVKYDPDAQSGISELYLYRDDTPVGVARLVNFTDNSKRKRTGSLSLKNMKQETQTMTENEEELICTTKQKENTISYSGTKSI